MPRDCRFLGSHPLAGSEKSGPPPMRGPIFSRAALPALTSTEYLLKGWWISTSLKTSGRAWVRW